MTKEKRTTKKASRPTKPYSPTDREREAVVRFVERRRRTAPVPRYKIDVTGPKSVRVAADHPEEVVASTLLADTFATGDLDLAHGLRDQLIDAARSGPYPTAHELDLMLRLVRGIGPRDETEALLACQMAAIHDATMVAARRLNHTETISQQDSASNMLNKLARTFASQLEALKRYRSAGEQTIKVQHVTVNEGGQAIVGNVSQGDGGMVKNGDQPHEPRAEDERRPALLGHEQAVPLEMQSAGGARLDGVSVPRGARRCTEGDG
jgi:hypothetical protein